MKLLAFTLFVIYARCQEEERADSCAGQPTINYYFNQDGSQVPGPSKQQRGKHLQGKPGKVGPPGPQGQKGEVGGLNYTLAESLKRELDEVKEELTDAKAKLKSSEAKFDEMNRELTDIKSQFESRFPPSSCSDIKGATENNGEYLINPDHRHLTSFYVFCNFSGNVTETIIQHYSRNDVEATGCDGSFCSKRIIIYRAPLRQISALIKKSRSCRQFLKIRCFAAHLGSSRWLSPDGAPHQYWGGATSRRRNYCACGESGSCYRSHKCNCLANDRTERSDEGFLTFKDHLPVTELQLGDVDSSYERVWYTLGPLICSD